MLFAASVLGITVVEESQTSEIEVEVELCIIATQHVCRSSYSCSGSASDILFIQIKNSISLFLCSSSTPTSGATRGARNLMITRASSALLLLSGFARLSHNDIHIRILTVYITTSAKTAQAVPSSELTIAEIRTITRLGSEGSLSHIRWLTLLCNLFAC